MPVFVSVVVTVLNEARRLPDLLDTLAAQEPPFEVIIVDAGSTDGSREIVERFSRDHDFVRLVLHPGKRGASRNRGVKEARGDVVAFIDGDCIANPFWLKRLRAASEGGIAAGRTSIMGYWAFERLQRVELEYRGQDVSVPSSNLIYPRNVFLAIGGFDERFVTAEDIDLNYRAVAAGHRIRQVPDAVVYARARDSVMGFIKQAYWNGYGRKQLTLKHGQLWGQYSFERLIQHQMSPWGLVRLAGAILGYLSCKMRESDVEWRSPPLSSPLEARA